MTNELTGARLERCLRQAEAQPESAAAHFNLGLACTRKGHVDRAEQAYREALRLNPDLVEGWVNLGGVLMLKWDFKGAIEANEEALKRNKDMVLAHYNIGQACVYLGDGEGVLRANSRVIELDPGHAAAHYFLAVGFLSLGRHDAAREAVARARALGHSPTPEFLRALENANKTTDTEDRNLVKQVGVDAPTSPERR